MPKLLDQLGLKTEGGARLWRPKGCPKCNGTGYFGRISINEVLTLSDAIRRQILHHAEATELQRVALAAGMRPMILDGLAKAAAGITTIEEVLRVTREAE
jgi:general secretion pathway protein E